MHIGFQDTSTLSARDQLRALLRALQQPADPRRQVELLGAAFEFLYGRAARRLPRGERALLLGAVKTASRRFADAVAALERPPHLPRPRRGSEPALGAWFEQRGLSDEGAALDSHHGTLDDALAWVTDLPFSEPTTPMRPAHVRREDAPVH